MAKDSSRFDPANGESSPDDTERRGANPLPEETAQYIADLSSELAQLARRSGMDLLATLLDMARLEAMELLQGRRDSGAG
ncbi:MAG: hypothetical protein ABWY78_19285 [Microvirga sp.]